MRLHSHLLHAVRRTEFQDQSGGRGPGSAPAAAVPSAVAGASFLPLDSPDLKPCVTVTLRLEDGREIPAFLDPVYGWMDPRGVCLPPVPAPAGWRPA